ncbi:MAG TPA: GNAT family N-acetyltransferase [Chloroflexia bacterium]|nr:GNAT family N-acetyltransferase [Chloroflexia bacterium]
MPFELQPTLRGELVVLRPLAASDFDALYDAARDPTIWTQHPQHDRWRLEVFRPMFEGGLASGGALLATDAATGAVIGWSRFLDYDQSASQVEIGWTFLARAYWGGAYNGEMKRLMLAHAFRFVDNVIFVVAVDNWRSRRAVEKIGGRGVGTRPAIADQPARVVYRITRAAFGDRTEPGEA